MRVVREPIDRALREDGIVEQRDPFLDGPIAREDRGDALVPLDDELVEIAGLNGVETSETEVVEDEKVLGDEPSEG